jgi:hypothetical protein
MLGAAAAAAQPVTFGLKGGIPLTDFFSDIQNQSFVFNENTKRFIVGPTFEVRLPFGLGIELDALYRHLDYSGSTPAASETITGDHWEFPLLAKYKFPSKIVRPYVDAGFAFGTLSGLKQSVETATGLSSAPATNNYAKGFVMGGGVDIKLLVLHISPEVRYTHWGSAGFEDPLSLVHGSQNQAELLLGIAF